MKEVSFSIPVSGVIRIGEGSVTVTVNRAETAISFEPVKRKDERISLEKGRTMFDIVLDVARQVAKRSDTGQFSAAELYHEALRQYPYLKRNSWTSHVIASAPNHTSHKHYGARRDYFRYLGDGTYSLDVRYLDKT